MVSSIEGLEAFLRIIGLTYSRRGDMLVAEYEAAGERIGIAVGIDEAGYVRVLIPTDVEPTQEGLTWLLHENFSASGYSYGLDYDGFIVVKAEAPADCVGDARKLRSLMAVAVEGYRRLMERVKEAGTEETTGRQS